MLTNRKRQFQRLMKKGEVLPRGSGRIPAVDSGLPRLRLANQVGVRHHVPASVPCASKRDLQLFSPLLQLEIAPHTNRGANLVSACARFLSRLTRNSQVARVGVTRILLCSITMTGTGASCTNVCEIWYYMLGWGRSRDKLT